MHRPTFIDHRDSLCGTVRSVDIGGDGTKFVDHRARTVGGALRIGKVSLSGCIFCRPSDAPSAALSGQCMLAEVERYLLTIVGMSTALSGS